MWLKSNKPFCYWALSRFLDSSTIEMNITSTGPLGKQSFLLKETASSHRRRWEKNVSAPRAEGERCFYNKREGLSHDHWLFPVIVKLLWSAAGGFMVVTRNKEAFCEGNRVLENFMQESTGTDKVKMYGWASCLVATRCTPDCNRDKVNLLFLSAWFLSLGLRAPGSLSFSYKACFAQGCSPILFQNSCPPVLLSHFYGLTMDGRGVSKRVRKRHPPLSKVTPKGSCKERNQVTMGGKCN